MSTGRIQNILTLRALLTPPVALHYYFVTREIRFMDCLCFNPVNAPGAGEVRVWHRSVGGGVSQLSPAMDPGALAQTVARPVKMDPGNPILFQRSHFVVGESVGLQNFNAVADKKVICWFIPPSAASTTQTLT